MTRKVNESVMLGDDIEVMVVEIRGEQVRLGFTAPRKLPVHRKEVWERIKAADAGELTRLRATVAEQEDRLNYFERTTAESIESRLRDGMRISELARECKRLENECARMAAERIVIH